MRGLFVWWHTMLADARSAPVAKEKARNPSMDLLERLWKDRKACARRIPAAVRDHDVEAN